MFSGKTEELIRRVRRAVYARQTIQVFKPRTDNRYDATDLVSHNEVRVQAVAVDHAHDILRQIHDETAVVAIDEIQFFGAEVVDVVNELADRGLRVICAGLDQDYLGRPFEPLPELLAVAEYITKQLAICVVCGNPANRSQRMTASEARVVVGADNVYEARCRKCHSAHPAAGPNQETLPITTAAPSERVTPVAAQE